MAKHHSTDRVVRKMTFEMATLRGVWAFMPCSITVLGISR